MLLKDFFQMFPDEDSCENYLRAVREEIGVVCPKCGATKYKGSITNRVGNYRKLR